MPSVDWQIEGIQFVNCNCSYGCPCQFEATPTHGHCRGFEALRVDRGHFGETTLDGLTAALVYAWPGPIYEGNGEMQAIVDARATAAQRTALETILHGGETEEGKTHWWVYRAMSKTVHPTLLAAISFAVDIEGRTASVEVGDMLQSTGAPIRSPATGQEHRVRIEIPGGPVQGRISALRIEVDVPVEREFLEDVAVPAAGIRLPVTRTWAEIVKLDFTVQDAPGLSATTARFVDKLAAGPLVKCFNASGVATAGLIDVTVQGIVP